MYYYLTNDTTIIANAPKEFFVEIGPKLAQSIYSTVNPMCYINSILCYIVLPEFMIHDL